jgi:hypothetical protein
LKGKEVGFIQTAAPATTVAKALAVNDSPDGSQGEPQLLRRLLVADGLKVKGPAHHLPLVREGLAESYASDVHGVPVREVMAMRDGRHKALGDIAHRSLQFLYARGGGG